MNLIIGLTVSALNERFVLYLHGELDMCSVGPLFHAPHRPVPTTAAGAPAHNARPGTQNCSVHYLVRPDDEGYPKGEVGDESGSTVHARVGARRRGQQGRCCTCYMGFYVTSKSWV